MILLGKSTAAGILAALAGVASATVHMSVDFASAYFFRGSYTDSGFVQPAIDISGFGIPEKYGSVLVGVWGNYALDDDDVGVDGYQFSEIDWYGYYSLPAVVENLELFVGYIEYVFPNVDAVTDKEANVGFQYDIDELELGATAYYGTGGDISSDIYYSLSAYFTFEVSERLDAVIGTQVGYYDPSTGPAGWNDQTVDLSAYYSLGESWYIGASLEYVIFLDMGDYEDMDSIEIIGTLGLGTFF